MTTTTQTRPRSVPTTHPTLLRTWVAEDRTHLKQLLDTAPIEIADTLDSQLAELVQTRHPTRKLSVHESREAVSELVGSRSLAGYGTWVFYPWSRRLVHVLPPEEFIELRTSRNRYLITAAEQAALATKKVGIVGLSVGQSVAMAMALERGAGELRLADFDTLELSNLNRVRATLFDIGLPKVVIAARAIAELDPYLAVRCFLEGLTEGNADAFFNDPSTSLGAGSGKLDLVVDECDGLDMKVRLREKARELGIPVVMQTSDRGMLDIERFDLEATRPFFHGLAGDLRAADLVGLTNEEKVPSLLKILGASTLSTRITASLIEVERSVRTWPQLGSAVTLGGGLAADAARRILLGELRDSGRFYVDLGAIVRDLSPVPSPKGGGESSPGGFRHQPKRETMSRGSPPPLGREASPPGKEGTGERSSHSLIRQLVSRAILAPSGGNHQPWLWTVRGNTLELRADPAQRNALTDFEDLATTASLGAAAESLVLAAHAAGLEVRSSVAVIEDSVVATFELGSSAPNEAHDFDYLAAHLERRQTDRRLGDRSPLPLPQWEELQNVARSVPGAELVLVTERPAIEDVADLIGQGDRFRMLDPGLRHEMLGELRWSREEAETSGDGLEVESLALSATDRAGLELCRRHEALELLAQWNLGSGLARMGQRLAESASAIGLLVVKPADRLRYFQGGRALQRVWLAATRAGLALHPMTFLPYGMARVARGGGAGFAPATVAGLQSLRPVYLRAFGLTGDEGEVLLFRVFSSKGPVTHSVRRSIDQVLRFAES